MSAVPDDVAGDGVDNCANSNAKLEEADSLHVVLTLVAYHVKL